MAIQNVFDDIAPLPRYSESTATHLLSRPSIPFHGSLLRQLMMKRMITRQQDDAEPLDSIPVLFILYFTFITRHRMKENFNSKQVSPIRGVINNTTIRDTSVPHPLNMDSVLDTSQLIPVVAHEEQPLIQIHVQHPPAPEDSGVEIETLRPGLSRDASVAGSMATLSASKLV